MAIQRPHYFDHQLLIEQDFTLEQNYHLDMRRRLNRGLYGFGVVEGLRVTKTANRSVTVEPGMAIDSQGREIVLDGAPRVVTITAPAGSRVFITAAYQETQTDQSTTTGATGNTRWTEDPIIVAVTATPPSDGSVIRLADFETDAAANVPGNVGDVLDVRGRQLVGAKGALRSINNITNPGGNLNLVGGQSIIIGADDVNDRITIGETHSTRTDNPHNTTAAQIGAMAVADYDLRRRAIAAMAFDQTNANGASVPVNTLGFQPKVAIVSGMCQSLLGTRTYGGGVGGFAFLDGVTTVQRCFGFAITRLSISDWSIRGLVDASVFTANIQDGGATPVQQENLRVALTFTLTGLTAVLSRTPVAAFAPLSQFSISLHLLCLG